MIAHEKGVFREEGCKHIFSVNSFCVPEFKRRSGRGWLASEDYIFSEFKMGKRDDHVLV